MANGVSHDGNGWSGYQRLVLSRLDTLDNKVEQLGEDIHEMQRDDINALKIEVAMLKVKAGIWGAAAGLLPAALFVGYQLLGSA